MGRIALCGVFDIPNYGDHLFPLVLREELSRRGYAGNVVLFSPFQAEESFVENSNVHSLDDLERMHMEEPFFRNRCGRRGDYPLASLWAKTHLQQYRL